LIIKFVETKPNAPNSEYNAEYYPIAMHIKHWILCMIDGVPAH